MQIGLAQEFHLHFGTGLPIGLAHLLSLNANLVLFKTKQTKFNVVTGAVCRQTIVKLNGEFLT